RQGRVVGTVAVGRRCAGSLVSAVRVRTRGGGTHHGVMNDVGPDWLLLGSDGAGETLISLRAVTAIEGLRFATGEPLSAVDLRFDLRLAVRGIARDRAPVIATIVGASGGTGHGHTEMSGTVDRVGADFIELAQHATWEPRRESAVRSVVLVPLRALDSVR